MKEEVGLPRPTTLAAALTTESSQHLPKGDEGSQSKELVLYCPAKANRMKRSPKAALTERPSLATLIASLMGYSDVPKTTGVGEPGPALLKRVQDSDATTVKSNNISSDARRTTSGDNAEQSPVRPIQTNSAMTASPINSNETVSGHGTIGWAMNRWFTQRPEKEPQPWLARIHANDRSTDG